MPDAAASVSSRLPQMGQHGRREQHAFFRHSAVQGKRQRSHQVVSAMMVAPNLAIESPAEAQREPVHRRERINLSGVDKHWRTKELRH